MTKRNSKDIYRKGKEEDLQRPSAAVKDGVCVDEAAPKRRQRTERNWCVRMQVVSMFPQC
jgi:hypothetical protein